MVKNPPANTGDRRCGFDPWVRKILWSRKWKPPLQYSCLENSMDRELWWAYSPWGHKELDTTELLNIHACTSFIVIIKYLLYSPCCIMYSCSFFYTYYFVPLNPFPLYCLLSNCTLPTSLFSRSVSLLLFCYIHCIFSSSTLSHIIQCLSFSVWLISPNTMPCKSIHIAANVKIHSFLCLNSIALC